jgi:hypothetical protein
MRFGEFINYNAKNLSMDEKISMFRDCMEISYVWWADTLDCSVSTSRQYFKCSFDEILSCLKEDSHVVVINRGTWGGPIGENREHFEIAFRTMTSPVDYFLFIQVDTEKMPPILDKYRLELIASAVQ